jgi:tol-pal system protein YbgF
MRSLKGKDPMRLNLLTVAALATLAGCASTPAEDDPVQVKLNDLDARVARIERVVSNQSLVQLAQNLDSVQADVRKLRGRVEELEYSNEALKKQQRDTSGSGAGSSLAGGSGTPVGPGQAGGSVANLGTAGAAGAVGATGVGDATAGAGASGSFGPGAAAAGAGAAGAIGSAPPANTSVDQAVYNQAFEALKAGSYSVAITGFRDFLSTYPSSGLAENAQYWLGEAYYVSRDYDDAAGAFRNVLTKWPQSRKAPDAMLKLGFTQFEQKRYADSRKTLQDVTQKYPDSDAARLASDRLKRIPADSR